MSKNNKGKTILGIDLGTTNSCVAIHKNGNTQIINNREGLSTTPSIVAFIESEKDEKGNYIPSVGMPAKNQAITNPNNTIYSIKRLIGKKYSQLTVEDRKKVPYKLIKGKGDRIEVLVGKDKNYTAEEISSFILREMKQVAQDYLGQDITEAVVTVPAYFNDAERQATKDAGKIAGLNVSRIINEPTAAALSYGIDKEEEATIVVYDLGGGTFDVTILELGDGVFDVKSTHGDSSLGGDDFDDKIIELLINDFKSQKKIDLGKDPMALQRIKQEAEKAKKSLSSSTSYTFNLPYITVDKQGPLHLHYELTRAKFEGLIADLVKRTLDACTKAMSDAKLTKTQINKVLLVGGSTRVPYVQNAVKDLFGKEPSKEVNPDEAVARGAAIQGGILSGDVGGVLLLDVTPASVGIETQGGILTKIIEKNTTIPTKKAQIFSTAQDNQPSVDLLVYQGDRAMAKDNKLLGRFELGGIDPARRGVPQINVTFDMDANGILHVSAEDMKTKKVNSIRIEGSSNLSEEEKERMAREAEENAEADSKRRKQAEKVNEAESMIDVAERQLKDHKDTLSDSIKEKLQSGVDSLKSAKESAELESMEKEILALREIVRQVATDIAKKESTKKTNDSSNTETEQEASSEPEIQEAQEVKEEDDDKESK